jgi:hypothetical protein
VEIHAPGEAFNPTENSSNMIFFPVLGTTLACPDPDFQTESNAHLNPKQW